MRGILTCGHMNSYAYVRVCAYAMQSHTIYSGVCSAVAYLYRRVRLPIPAEMTRNFKEYISSSLLCIINWCSVIELCVQLIGV